MVNIDVEVRGGDLSVWDDPQSPEAFKQLQKALKDPDNIHVYEATLSDENGDML
jgi:hypothetical protein